METILEQHRYIGAAFHAVKYVQSKMDIGASNKLPQSYWGWPARTMCVSESREQIRKDLKQQGPALRHSGGDQIKAMMETWAYWATTYGCGNCGEQSAMAFVHLRDIWKVHPIDWMQVGNFSHAFAVLGRIGATNPANILTWNPEAVICDPYYGESISAAACARLRGKPIELLYRNEGQTLGEPGALEFGAC